MTTTVTVSAAGRTHVGLVRRRNEDSLYLGQSLVAVADGLGGHVAGDIASTTAIDALRSYDRPAGPADADLTQTLGQAVNAVNEAIRRKTTTSPELAGMATTLVALMWSGTKAILANLGDSRAYLRRGTDRSAQITEDHIYSHLVADAADVPNLPGRLSRFLDGRADGRSPDLTTWKLQPEDRFLLCSDGLSSYVPHRLIDDAMRSSEGRDDVADHLISLALDHGGPDNVTVVVVDVVG